jgi:hypothetical protein
MFHLPKDESHSASGIELPPVEDVLDLRTRPRRAGVDAAFWLSSGARAIEGENSKLLQLLSDECSAVDLPATLS